MTRQEETQRKSRRDLLLILLILPFGVMCMFMTGQVAIKLAPTWVLQANMFSNLDPNINFSGMGDLVIIEPLDPGILTQPAWGNLFLTPNAVIPPREVPEVPTIVPARSPQPPPEEINTPVVDPPPTATLGGPIVIPTTGSREADLAITKSDGSSQYTPGTSINYTIIVTNNGPDGASDFHIEDNIPASISGLTVICSPSASCGTNASSGNTISFLDASLSVNAQFRITVSGLVASGTVGNLSNTANIIIPSVALVDDPVTANNSATDTNSRFAIADLAITKDDGSTTYTANSPITYTIVVTNSGPSDALGVRVVDNIPSQIASWDWTCTMTNATGCNGITGSSANFTDTGLNIQVGGQIEYTVTAYLPANASTNTSSIANTASVLLPGGTTFIDPNLSNNNATDTDIPYIDLQITKTDGGATFSPSGTVTYTVTVTNNSTFNLTGIGVSDPKPAQYTNWTWTCVTANPSCDGVTNSAAAFADTINLTAGSSQVYTVTANVSGAPGTGNISNTATVGVPTGLVDQVLGNNSATETTPPNIDLQTTKTDGTATYTPGGTVTYTVTVTNNSPFDLTGISVTDSIPALVTSWTWTCAPDAGPPGASCTAGPSSTNINDTAVNLPSGRSVIYTIVASIHANAVGTLENTASVSPPAGLVDVVPGNDSATDTDINASGEPEIGPPDNTFVFPAGGTFSTYLINPPITSDGTSAPDFVFFERDTGSGIALDTVIIEISTDGSGWTQVFNWGDGSPDLNSNVGSAVGPECGGSEYDDCPIPSSYLYSSGGLDSGITIDIDSLGLSGSYPWIRFYCPTIAEGNSDNQCDIDAIQPYYP